MDDTWQSSSVPSKNNFKSKYRIEHFYFLFSFFLDLVHHSVLVHTAESLSSCRCNKALNEQLFVFRTAPTKLKLGHGLKIWFRMFKNTIFLKVTLPKDKEFILHSITKHSFCLPLARFKVVKKRLWIFWFSHRKPVCLRFGDSSCYRIIEPHIRLWSIV